MHGEIYTEPPRHGTNSCTTGDGMILLEKQRVEHGWKLDIQARYRKLTNRVKADLHVSISRRFSGVSVSGEKPKRNNDKIFRGNRETRQKCFSSIRMGIVFGMEAFGSILQQNFVLGVN